jgi:hypothetical protein
MSEHPPGWHPDPMGRHEHRYWDGTQWTDHVADQGQMNLDPVHAAPQEVSAPAEPSRVDLPAIDPSQVRVTGAMPAIQPHQQEVPATGAPATPEPATPAAAVAAEQPTTPMPADPEPAAEPSAPAFGGDIPRHPILAALLSIAAPGSGHVYLGRRPQIGYGLLVAFLVAIFVGWFVSWPIGLIIYLVAAGFAVFDLRGDIQPAATSDALDVVDSTLAWRIVTGGGIAILIGLILPWYRIAVDISIGGVNQSTSASANGFDIGWPKVLLLIVAIAAIALGVMQLTQSSPNRSALPEQLPLILAGAAALAWLATIYRMLDIPGDAGAIDSFNGVGGAKVDTTFGRGIGAWLDYAGTLAVAAGAYAASRSTSRAARV